MICCICGKEIIINHGSVEMNGAYCDKCIKYVTSADVAVTEKGKKMELNREQIIKAWDICTQNNNCDECPYDEYENCLELKEKQTVSLIKELTAENESLMRDKTSLECIVSTARNQAKADTVRKMQEKLKERTHNMYPSIDSYCLSRKAVFVTDIDQIAKEILEDK